MHLPPWVYPPQKLNIGTVGGIGSQRWIQNEAQQCPNTRYRQTLCYQVHPKQCKISSVHHNHLQKTIDQMVLFVDPGLILSDSILSYAHTHFITGTKSADRSE